MSFVEVVILGGGSQGLAVLDTLCNENKSALVISETPLGEGQSTHSHGYMHDGYAFNSVLPSLMAHWPQDLISKIKNENSPVYFAAPDATLTHFTSLWEKSNKAWEAVSTPAQLLHGEIESMKFAKINDFTFSEQALLRALIEKRKQFITFGKATSIEVKSDNLVSIDIQTASGNRTVLLAFCFLIYDVHF